MADIAHMHQIWATAWGCVLRQSMSNGLSRNFLRTFLLTFIPITLQALIASSRTVVDVLMTSGLGAEEVAVVGFGSRIVFILILLVLGVCNGAGIVIAQFYGGGHERRAILSIGSTLLVSLGLAVLGVLLMIIVAPAIAHWSSSDPVIRQLALDYIVLASMAVVPFSLSFALSVGLRSIGRSSLATWPALIGLLSHIALNYMLIFGNWGAPQLGVSGAAYASLLSAVIELAIVCLWVRLSFTDGLFRLCDLRGYFHRDTIARILRVSVPICLGSVVWACGIFMYSLIAAQAGTISLATLALIAPVESIATAFMIGLSSTTNVLVGHALGRRDFHEATLNALSVLLWTFVITVLISATIYLLKPWLLMLYSGVGAQVLAVADPTIDVLCIVLIFRALNVTIIVGALRAGADNTYPIFMDVVTQWLVAIPLSCVCVFYLQLPFPAVFFAINCEEISKLILAYHRFTQFRWLHQIRPEAEAVSSS